MSTEVTFRDLGLVEDWEAPRPRRTAPPTVREMFRNAARNTIGDFTEDSYRIHPGGRASRIALRRLLTANDPAVFAQVLRDRTPRFAAKAPQFRNALKRVLGDALVLSDTAASEARRRVVGVMLHPRRVDAVAPLLEGLARAHAEAWAAAAAQGCEIDLAHEAGAFTVEAAAAALLDRPLGAARAGRIADLAHELAGYANVRDAATMFRVPQWVPRPQRRAARPGARRLLRLLDGYVDELEAARRPGDPYDRLCSALDVDGRAGRRARRDEVAGLLLTGHDTTANVLSWVLLLLAMSPRVSARLQEELDRVLAGRAVAAADLPRLPYLRNVLLETLRLYPPAASITRQAREDAPFGDHVARRGDILLLIPWQTHRSPDRWALPDHFIPERFDPAIGGAPPRDVFIPFSAGPRRCPAEAFALLEMAVMVAGLLARFDIRLAPGIEPQPEAPFTQRPAAPVRVVVAPRTGRATA